MVPKGVLNVGKKGFTSRTFHLFYRDMNTSYLFDSDLADPIIWGNKAEVMRVLCRRIDELLKVPRTTKVKVCSYIIDEKGYRRIDTYEGPIETIAKYIKHI